MSFQSDLEFGEQKQKDVIAVLETFFLVKESVGYDKEKDLEVWGKIEVKYDRKAHQTGNIALEVRCNGKISGLSTTKSQAWVICTDDGCWLCPLKDLRALAKTYGTHQECWDNLIRGGDNNQSEIALVPYTEIKKFIKIK